MFCQSVKEFLSQHEISFEEHFVDKDSQALETLKKKIGRLATPTIVFGDEVVVGFDKEKIISLLGISN